MRSNFSRLISNWQTSSTKCLCLVPNVKTTINSSRGFLFTNITALVWKSTTMSTVYNDLCSLHIFSLPFSTFTHFYLFFFIWRGRAVSFQNNLFHHLTMKSKIGYRSLIMTIILIVIFSKKELLIKRKRKKR